MLSIWIAALALAGMNVMIDKMKTTLSNYIAASALAGMNVVIYKMETTLSNYIDEHCSPMILCVIIPNHVVTIVQTLLYLIIFYPAR